MATEITLELNNHEYKIVKLNALGQFNLARKILSLFAPIMAQGGAVNEYVALFSALSTMSDKDANQLFCDLLRSVSVKEEKGRGWSPLVSGNTFMYDNLDLSECVDIAAEVIRLNLAGFFSHLSGVIAVMQTRTKTK